MRLLIQEHKELQLEGYNNDWLSTFTPRLFKLDRNKKIFPFEILKSESFYILQSGYFIGADWLIPGESFIQIEPKLNTGFQTHFADTLEATSEEILTPNVSESALIEVDYLKMLLTVYSGIIDDTYLQDLVFIAWEDEPLVLEQKQDALTPFLVVQFLQLLKKIVKKGLKKSYYRVEEQVQNRIKGRIQVSRHLRENVFKNRFQTVACTYETFGIDSAENRFLKKVFHYVKTYVQTHFTLFGKHVSAIQHLIDYCDPAFLEVSDDVTTYQLKNLKTNAFFKEYKQVLKIGDFILKKFSYNFSKVSESKMETPPFWIDMPRLFELYVYHNLLVHNFEDKKQIKYQFSTYGNSLDFLISHPNYPIVIDTKYKLKYAASHIHEDIRQVAGYARLNKVRKEVGLDLEDTTIPCLIIYPDQNGVNLQSDKLLIQELISDERAIESYYKVYKLGVQLPLVEV